MGITTERLPRSRVALEIEVDQDRVEQSKEKAVRRIAQKVRIPGFRPGKAPRNIIERHVGEAAILQEALDALVPDLYNEAIESEDIDAIGQPEIDLKSVDPLVLTATVPVRPSVDLGDYRSLRAPKPEVQTSDDQVEETITNLRRRYATLEPVDRPIEWGDRVRVDVTVNLEGQDEPHEEEGAEFTMQQGAVVSLPGFLDRLIGLERGGPYEFEVVLPEDFEAKELAGKTASYTVTVQEVKQELLPDLDDEFVKSLDEDGFETVDQLRERLQEDIRRHLEQQAEAAYQDEIVDLLIAQADIDYPELLVEREIDRLIDEQSNHASHTEDGLRNWLEAIGASEQEVRDQLRESADLAVRRALALGELISAEEIEATDEDLDAEVQRLADQMAGDGDDAEQRRETLVQILGMQDNRGQMRSQLITRKALDRLVEIASQPDDEDAGGERRRGTRRRRSRGASDEADDVEQPEASAEVADAAPEATGAAGATGAPEAEKQDE